MRSVCVSAIGTMYVGALLFAAPAIAADGIYMSWSRCFGEGLGTQNRSFACDSNDGSEVIVLSFKLDTPISQVSGNEIVIDVLSQDDPMPPWWDMKDPGTCRQISLSFNSTQDPNDAVCVDWGQGQSSGGIGAYSMELGAVSPALTTRHRRLKMALAVPLANIVDLSENVEYFSCNLTLNHAKTVGTGACAGCSGQVCLVFNRLIVTSQAPGGQSRSIDGNGSPGSIVTWQGTGPNCLLVPTRNATWGQVKAHYR